MRKITNYMWVVEMLDTSLNRWLLNCTTETRYEARCIVKSSRYPEHKYRIVKYVSVKTDYI